MDGWSVLEAVAAGVGALAGIGGLIVAGRANSRTKQANEIAEAANKLAAQALGKAREANDIAENANKLSEDANAIAQREAAKQSDPSHVEWKAKWDEEASVVTIKNHGRDVALNTTALFRRDGIEELITPEDRLARLDSFSIPFPEVPKQRQDHLIQDRARLDSYRVQSVFVVPNPFGYFVSLDIRWFSELGNPRQQTVDVRIS